MTVEPGIYIREEGFAVRLENDFLVTEQRAIDLMAGIPIEPEEIEQLMSKRAGKNGRNGTNGRTKDPYLHARAQSRHARARARA
jgi:hypothetical protein